MSSIVMEIKEILLQTDGAKCAINETNSIIKSEIKKYRRQDIILSERETAENEKVAKILEDLSSKITSIYKGQ